MSERSRNAPRARPVEESVESVHPSECRRLNMDQRLSTMDRLGNPLFTDRMIDGYPGTLTLLAAIGAGVNAGVFFAFSTFVMQGLGHLTAPRGIAAMQAINKQAPTPVFMTALMGTALLSVGAVVVAVANLDEPWAAYLLVGGLLYARRLTVMFLVPG